MFINGSGTALHMFKIKTWIYEPVYYLNSLVLIAQKQGSYVYTWH